MIFRTLRGPAVSVFIGSILLDRGIQIKNVKSHNLSDTLWEYSSRSQNTL